ncbi:MAG: single-stranded-DNA-specific exonuclease RecJ [Mycobacterium leprae]
MAKPYRAMRWRLELPDPAACWQLSRALQISPVTAQVLYNRGLTTPAAAQQFLNAGRGDILDPFLLKDMDQAVRLIRNRVAERKPIMVYGDYDVDGVTGTTILVLALRRLGAIVDYYIPNRFAEGYGLNVGALKEIHGRGHDFVLSVDTGVSAVEEAEAAKAMGMTLVISDHHEPGPILPDVPALINPKRPDCTYPFKGLSGVGVAFKLVLALDVPNAWDLLDIVTMGTIADMVPLVGENRAIVREGLTALGSTTRPGLAALMAVAGVQQPVTATHIGYSLGPRINALGRMGSAMEGVELLTTDDPVRAKTLAQKLDDENRNRQDVEAGILQQALAQAEQLSAAEKSHVLVLAGEGWHHGVVGICASRVLEAYYRPAILLSVDGDEVRGSARSIPAFHMHRALSQVSDLFVKFGGHAAAAGMTLKHPEDVPVLRQRLNEIGAKWLRPEDLVPELPVDGFVRLDQVNDQLLSEFALLEPHGIGNPAPVLAVADVAVAGSRVIGREGQHLKLLLQAQGSLKEAVGWNMSVAKPPVKASVRVAFHPEYDTYQGAHNLRLTLKDLQVMDDSAGPGILLPELPLDACLAWDPLSGLEPDSIATPAVVAEAVTDVRGDRLLAAAAMLQSEAAAAAESEEEVPIPEPTRPLYVAALAATGRVLVLVNSPWAAMRLQTELQRLLPDQQQQVACWLPGQPEPEAGQVVITPYGNAPGGSYSHTVLYHPPYHEGHVTGGHLHLLWQESDWESAETTLLWPYPDRDVLAQLYRLLKLGMPTDDQVAQAFSTVPGPWNQLQLAAGLQVFRELGLCGTDGTLVRSAGGTKLQLESSALFRRGLSGRAVLARLKDSDWPSCIKAL